LAGPWPTCRRTAVSASPLPLLQLPLKALPLSPLLLGLRRNVRHRPNATTTTELRAATWARAGSAWSSMRRPAQPWRTASRGELSVVAIPFSRPRPCSSVSSWWGMSSSTSRRFFTVKLCHCRLKGGERILSRVDVLWRIARWGDGGGRTSMEGRTTTTTMVGRTTTTTSMVGRGAMVAELGRRLVLRLGSYLLLSSWGLPHRGWSGCVHQVGVWGWGAS